MITLIDSLGMSAHGHVVQQIEKLEGMWKESMARIVSI